MPAPVGRGVINAVLADERREDLGIPAPARPDLDDSVVRLDPEEAQGLARVPIPVPGPVGLRPAHRPHRRRDRGIGMKIRLRRRHRPRRRRASGGGEKPEGESGGAEASGGHWGVSGLSRVSEVVMAERKCGRNLCEGR